MPNALRQFAKPVPSVPPPMDQLALIHSEIVHSMPAAELFGLEAPRAIRSDLIHSMPAVELFGLESASRVRSELISSLGSTPPIQSIQEGSITIPGLDLYAVAAINAVDLSKSYLVFLGSSGIDIYQQYAFARLSFDSTTVVRATKLAAYDDYYVIINFMVIEFSGGIKSIQIGTVTVADGATTGNATVTAVDLAKSFLSYLGATGTYGQGGSQYDLVRIRRLNTTTIRGERIGTLGTTNVAFHLVEFS